MTDLAAQKGSHSRAWFKRVDDCPNESKHIYGPAGYVAWHEWASREMNNYRQEQCPGCGLWLIWTPANGASCSPTERTGDA